MNIEELIERLGKDTVLNEMIQWLPTDALNEICDDIMRLYDIDIENND